MGEMGSKLGLPRAGIEPQPSLTGRENEGNIYKIRRLEFL